jgi:ferredoxin
MAGDHVLLSMTFDTADVGMISIDPSTCTACEMCAQICPTDALRSDPDVTGVRISFDPQVCVGCGQCVATCPELEHAAIELERRFDVSEWAAGRREVRFETTAACEICGEPVAPAAMLTRINEMLGEEAAETMALISRRCITCRGR